MAFASNDVLSEYLAGIGQGWRVRSNDSTLLADAIRLDSEKHALLHRALHQLGKVRDLTQLVASRTSIPSSERIISFVCSLLEYIAHHPSIQDLLRKDKNQVSTTSAEDYRAAYDKWAETYSRASLCFAQQDIPFFGSTLRYVGVSYVLLAIVTDDALGSASQPSVTDAVSKLSRTTGIAAVDRTPAPGNKTKRAEVLWLANASFRCYFKLKNIRLCETVLGSVENALSLNRNFASGEQKERTAASSSNSTSENQEQLGLACYSRADRVTYKYYLGLLRLSQHRIRKAYNELRWAFDNCTNAHMANKRLILIPLCVSALILGIYPSRSLLVSAKVDGPFGHLMERLRLGDGAGMVVELEKWREWHRKRGFYLLLREKLQIGAWRNLMRRSFLVSRLQSAPMAVAATADGPPAKTPPPTLKLSVFLTASKFAWKDDSLTMDDVECVVASLIDQGYLKAYVMHSSSRVVFRRTADFGFLPMAHVYQ